MSSHQMSSPGEKPAGQSAGFELPELTAEQLASLPVAARMARALLDPENSLLLETLYEGSNFTPVIGAAVGIQLTGDKVEDQSKLDPVRASLKVLLHEGGLAFQREDMFDSETNSAASTSVIEVVVTADKMRDFLDKKINELS